MKGRNHMIEIVEDDIFILKTRTGTPKLAQLITDKVTNKWQIRFL